MNLHSDQFELFSANKTASQSQKSSHSNRKYSSVTELKFTLADRTSKRTLINDQMMNTTELDASLSNFIGTLEALPSLSHCKIESTT